MKDHTAHASPDPRKALEIVPRLICKLVDQLERQPNDVYDAKYPLVHE